MSRFLEALECRTFLSAVTTTILNVDQAAIVSAGANGNTALKALLTDIKSGITAITADLKTLPKTNAPLLLILKVDVAKFEGTVAADLGLLLKPSFALSKKATAAGLSLFTKATTKTVAVTEADISALGSVTISPLANLLDAFHGFHAESDFRALVTANPTATQLATDVATTIANANIHVTDIQNSASQFSTNIATLTSDLTLVQTTFGTFPNMVGTFNGTSLVTKGKDTGEIDDVTLVITSEDAAGNLVGTVTNVTQGLGNALQGTVNLNGKFSCKITPNKSNSNPATLIGQFSAGTLTGEFKDPNRSGTLSVTKAP